MNAAVLRAFERAGPRGVTIAELHRLGAGLPEVWALRQAGYEIQRVHRAPGFRLAVAGRPPQPAHLTFAVLDASERGEAA